jgi:hypothetical protein
MARRKTSSRKSTRRKYGQAASKSVKSAVSRSKRGTLRRGKSGHGGKVKSRKQAVAIGLSEARKKGAKVPAAPKKRTKRAGAKRATKRAAKRTTKRTAKRTAKRGSRRS